MITGTLRIVAPTREDARALIVYLQAAATAPGVEVRFLPPHKGHRDGEWLAYASVTIEEYALPADEERPINDDVY